uniref:Transcription initiation factor IIB n=1 Tax=viral metagenome TaxID=1070528 RepID=A0A6C0EDD5_9ZZZZ
MNSKRKIDIDLDIDNISIDEYFDGIDFNEKVNTTTEFKNLNNFDDKTCEHCGSSDLIDNEGSIICTKCARVQDNVIDYNPEWRDYDDGKPSMNRCSQVTNVLLPQSSLGLKFVAPQGSNLQRIHIWNAMPYKERSLNNVFKIITKVCTENNIKKNVQDDAKIIYKIANDCKDMSDKKVVITRGKNRKGIIAAAVLLACKRNNQTLSPKEIASIFDLKHSEISRGDRNLRELLQQKKFNTNFNATKPEHFVFRYCDSHVPKLKNEYTEQAVKIAKNIERLNIASDHTPFSVAAASVLIMSELNGITKILTKKMLAERFNVSEVTIGKIYKKLSKYKHLLQDDVAVDGLLEKINNIQKTSSIIDDQIKERMKKFGLSVDENNKVVTQNTPDYLLKKMSLCTIDSHVDFIKYNDEFTKLLNTDLQIKS